MKVEKPESCDICSATLKGRPHVDGKTQTGPWANMCTRCHMEVGVGLGTGRGQKYDAEGNKVEG